MLGLIQIQKSTRLLDHCTIPENTCDFTRLLSVFETVNAHNKRMLTIRLLMNFVNAKESRKGNRRRVT